MHSQARKLQYCDIAVYFDNEAYPSEPAELEDLEILNISKDSGSQDIGKLDKLLDWLVLPSLKNIKSQNKNRNTNLSHAPPSLLTRSGCTLVSLEVNNSHVGFEHHPAKATFETASRRGWFQW